MSLVKCSQCGELYSDSYNSCPFCAEDEEFYRGTVKKRQRRTTEGRRKSPSIIGPVMILIILLVLGILAWCIFGRGFSGLFGADTDKPAVENVDSSEKEGSLDTVELIMDKTLRIAPGEVYTLVVTGGTSYEYVSSDAGVASVSGSGVIRALANGTTVITVTDESGATAVCSVTVSDEPEDTTDPVTTDIPGTSETTEKATKPTTATKVDISKLKVTTVYGTELPLTDGSTPGVFSTDISSAEGSYQLIVEGTSSTIKWKSSDTNVVTIDDEGNLKRVSAGTADVTARVGDVQLVIHVTSR